MRLNRFMLLTAALAAATPALARPGGWGGWGGDWRGGWNGPSYPSSAARRSDGPPEDRVIVSRFVAEGQAADALRTGAITVTGAPTGSGVDSRELATYEAAVVDQLAQIGYRTDTNADVAGQVTELHISHDVITPQEEKKRVSGEVDMGVSNRGSMVGGAVMVDLSKPKGALIATRLEARIRDKATGNVLWEGRADINTREGSDKWSDGVIANKLAAALFDGFPGTSGETLANTR